MRLHPVVPWLPIAFDTAKKQEKPRKPRPVDDVLDLAAIPHDAVPPAPRQREDGPSAHGGVDIRV